MRQFEERSGRFAGAEREGAASPGVGAQVQAGVPPRPGTLSRRRGAAGPGEGVEAAEDERAGGVYIISVAARLLCMHPQTLRKYERMGLVRPSRTSGRLRLYSEEDIAKLRLIKYLVDELGLNLAGVELAVDLADQLMGLRRQAAEVERAERLRDLLFRRVEELLQMLNATFPARSAGPDGETVKRRGAQRDGA